MRAPEECPQASTLRQSALIPLLCPDADRKAALARALRADLPSGSALRLEAPEGIPGRPARPELVAHGQLGHRDVRTPQGRAVLLHALAHIELNAIDLALDLVWRYPDLPETFYRQWTEVAREEALHFALLRERLRALGHAYGDFPAHGALWEMAERTREDLLARIALVPRTLEARGLDASPPIRDRLLAAGDAESAAILDLILRDEIGHVALGNHWFALLCGVQQRDPVQTFAELAERYRAPRPRGPFNLEARRAAGFSEEELQALQQADARGTAAGSDRKPASTRRA